MIRHTDSHVVEYLPYARPIQCMEATKRLQCNAILVPHSYGTYNARLPKFVFGSTRMSRTHLRVTRVIDCHAPRRP